MDTWSPILTDFEAPQIEFSQICHVYRGQIVHLICSLNILFTPQKFPGVSSFWKCISRNSTQNQSYSKPPGNSRVI